jgi:hypothetical protein
LLLKTAAFPSVNTILKYTLIYAPICCTSVTCYGRCVSISLMEYIGVSWTCTFFLVSWGGVRLSSLCTLATNWPIIPAPDDR